MAVERIHTSPSINFSETDRTFTTRSFGLTALGIAGEFQKGRAFDPILINDYTTFKEVFGGLNPCKFYGTSQPMYEGAYIAREYLTESDILYVTRILGLSGYNAGDAWGITFGAALDPATITVTNTETFSATIRYANGQVTSAVFSNQTIQDLYDAGEIDDTQLGGVDLVTGEVVSVGNTFIGDCETFVGARFNMAVTGVVETYICITGETAVGIDVEIPTEVQNCLVIYGAGTITEDSRFVITVTNAIVIRNLIDNSLTVVPEGIITLIGGTIEHISDAGLTITDGSIFLPNGDVFQGGSYQICDLNGNSAVYDCETISGSGYSITTGTTIITTTVSSGTTQIVKSQIPSGIVQIDFTGTVVELSGVPYAIHDNSLVALLRSYASYDGQETLNFGVLGNVISIESLDGGKINPLDDFKIKGTDRDGNAFEYIVSFDQTKKTYLPRVFGNFQMCCPAKVPLYVEEHFDVAFQNMLQQGLIYCIKPTVCYTQSLNNYKQQYQGAVTPWVVSELRGNRVFRLFRFHSFSHGNVATTDFKVSITNIRFDNMTFDVEVRAYSDTDKKPVILESYRRLTMNQFDNNYIARRIGSADGEFTLQSKYIMVEMARDCQADTVPAGFEGYPIRDYECTQVPQLQYKTEYLDTDRKRQVYLGLSDTVGIDTDFFTYKGVPNIVGLTEWTGTTNGFHLDVNAASVSVDGNNNLTTFDVGNAPFKNEAELVGTDYEQISSRKFTLVAYGGFDGWDIHRQRRTNTDAYQVNKNLGQLGLLAGNFDAYASENILEGQTVITSDYYAYLEGIRMFANRDATRISLLATPNVNTAENSNLFEEVIEMLETERCDSFHVVTTLDTDSDGRATTVNDFSSLLNGLYDTNYSATYAYWGQYFDDENNTYVWLPPTAEVMRNFAFTDKNYKVWFAGAGVNRGQTKFEKARKSLTLQDRDNLYDARVNPVATFKNATNDNVVYIWGNKTLQIAESALDRINVRRLMLYMRRMIEDASIGLLFDQNDETVRRQFESRVAPILNNIRTERGIFDYRIQIDRSNAAYNSNEMKVKIGVQPVRTLEFINIEFILTPAGASFEDI